MNKRIKLFALVVLITYILVAFVFFKNNQRTLAACCPGEPGCSGTCYGYRITPPGGCGCYTTTEGCAPGCGSGGPVCGNGSCESGENCSGCAADCGACCTTSRPGVTTLVSPADGSVINTNAVTLSYTNSTGWGNGCPNSNSFHVQYSQNCSGTWVDNGANTSLTNLAWGSTYCWRVRKYNGAFWDNITNVATWRFTINSTPVLIGSGLISADTCGNGISGSTSSQSPTNNVTNPITWSVSFTDPDANSTYKQVWFALVPSAGAYAENRDIVSYTDILAKANNSNVGAISFKYYIENTDGRGAINLWNSTSEWGTTRNGDLTNSFGTIRIKNINSTSRAYLPTVDTITANFQLEFLDTMMAGSYNIYAASIVENPGGTLVSSYATPTNPWIFKLVGNWSVDTQSPVPTVTNPTFKTDETFDVTWKATENYSGINILNSYIYADVAGTSLHDNTINLDINPPNYVLNYPQASNAGITIAEATLASPSPHNYKDNSPVGLAPTYGFKLAVRDRACNLSQVTNTFSPPSPWLVAYGGSISANGGITNIKIPDISGFSVAPYITDPVGIPYLSTYSALSGTVSLPSSKQSKFNEFALSYINEGSTPPIRSGYSAWYDYFYDLVGRNGSAITTISIDPGFTNPSATYMSTLLSATAGQKVVVNITDNLTIKTGMTCDIQGIIFVQKDLNIDPDFFKSGGNNACIFITKGSVNVGGGASKSASGSSAYDEIHALIFTDGMFTAAQDSVSVASECPDSSATLVRQMSLNWAQTNLTPVNGIYLTAGKYKFVYRSGAWSPSSASPNKWYANFALSKKLNITSVSDLTFVGTGSTVYSTWTAAEAAGKGKSAILTLGTTPNPNVYVFIQKITPPQLVGTVGVDIYRCPTSAITSYYIDGLYIEGGVISSNVDLQRALAMDKNATLPSIIFAYDPLYKETFKSEFSTRNYSIREVLE